jgi:hypothetical protein
MELVRYRLRQMYNIPPSVLAEQKGEHLFEMLRDLKCIEWEHKTAQMRKKLRGNK